MTENTPVKKKVSHVNLKERLLKYLIYLPFILICLSIAITVAYLNLRYAIPQYTSSLSLLIRSDKSSSSLQDQVLGNISLAPRRSNLSAEIAQLKSITLMTRVVKRINLNTKYFKVGQVKTSELYADLPFTLNLIEIKDSAKGFNVIFDFIGNQQFKLINGKTYHSGELIDNKVAKFTINLNKPQAADAENHYQVNFKPPWNEASSLASILQVRPQALGSPILSISITTEIPEKGRNIINQLVVEYNKTNVEDKNLMIQNTIRFIDDRIVLLTQELGGVESGIKDFKQRTQVVGLDQQSGTDFSQLNTVQQKINEIELQLEVMKMIEDYSSDPSKKFQIVPSTLGISDGTLSMLVSQYNQLQLSREELLKTTKEANPQVKVIDNQIERLRINTLEALKNVRMVAENLLAFNKQQYRMLQGRLVSIPPLQQEFLEIMRQQGIKEKLYLFLLQKREELAISEASAVGGYLPIDPAVSAGSPVAPDASGTYRLAVILGLVVPIGFIYLRELFNDKVNTKNQLLDATDCPTIGEIAHNSGKERMLVVGKEDRGVLAEQFRIVRTNIQFLLKDKTKSVLLVTSSIAGEGKTFTCMNIGAVWAVAGKRTVVLELDLRRPQITKSLNLPSNNIGITTFILGNCRADELAVPVEGYENLFVISAGPIPPNPSEIVLDKRMDELFEYLRTRFDIIVIDSAPVGLVSDAKILSRFADATIYVVRQRYTARKQLEMIDDLYQNKSLPEMGLLVNDVKVGGAYSYYGYGYNYSYNYNSKYQYVSDTQRVSFFKKLRNFFGI